MSEFRFNYVFAALMVLSLISAFIIPPRFTNPARAELQGLFSPISRPVHSIAEMIYGRFHPQVVIDEASPTNPRSDQTLLEENNELRATLRSLSKRFEDLSKLNDDRNLVLDIRPLCKPAAVVGVDSSGIRESLIISSPSLNALKQNLAVISAHEVVGKISRAGLTSAQVRLITDPGFVVTGQIRQFKMDPDGHFVSQRLEQLQPMIQGVGHGTMVIRNSISMKQVHELDINKNDDILIDDPDWPANLQGQRIGRITNIQASQNAPLYADVQVTPTIDLMHLKEVMVLVKE